MNTTAKQEVKSSRWMKLSNNQKFETILDYHDTSVVWQARLWNNWKQAFAIFEDCFVDWEQ